LRRSPSHRSGRRLRRSAPVASLQHLADL
jgi:hypothetical protein